MNDGSAERFVFCGYKIVGVSYQLSARVMLIRFPVILWCITYL